MKASVFCISVIILLSHCNLEQFKDQGTDNYYCGSFELKCPSSPYLNHLDKANSENINGETRVENFDPDWYSQAIERIQNEEYSIIYSDELSAFQSPNRANNIRFIYHTDGFTAKTRSSRIPKFDVNDKSIDEKNRKYEPVEEWEVKLQVRNEEFKIENGTIQSAGNKAWIENEKLRIDYTNTKHGMRQDFIIKHKPDGEGKLRLDLIADTKLKMIVGADALIFKNEKGEEMMKYSSLNVWDANGKPLRAYFEAGNGNKNKLKVANQSEDHNTDANCNLKLTQQSVSNGLQGPKTFKDFSIVVNDENATYPITVDPLSTSPNWDSEINQAGASFGINVATAGDHNGDGYSDVIIGANTYDNTGSNNGAIFGYNGSATGLSSVASWSRTITQNNAEFGNDVSTAGDVNGDGFSDVIIGSYRYTNTLSQEGAAFIYYGPISGTSGSANWSAFGGQSDAYFGISVSTAGDLDLNGFSDIVIGAYLYDESPYVDNGKAFVYFGTGSGFSTPWTYSGTQNSEGFGSAVSFAGDVDNSGGSDIIIGAYNYSNGQAGEGRVYIFRGSPGLMYFPNAPYTIESNSAGANFGVSVSTAGDVNGDAISDFLVGAYHYSNGEFQEGRAYLYLGIWQAPPVVSSWTIEGGQIGASYGLSVSTAGDVNGDGYGDVIIGSPYFDASFTDEGKAFVYLGNNSASGLSLTPYWTSTGGQHGAQYGYSVSIAGDVNGDGISDIVVGAPYFDGQQTDAGRCYAYYGSPTGLSLTSNWSKIGVITNQIDTDFGISVCTAGDINNDGYSDVVVGAPYFDVGANEGRIFVYTGSVNGLSTTSYNISPTDNYFYSFGLSVATAGDVNGDGYGDIIVGAPFHSGNFSNEGKAYLYYGYQYGLIFSGWTKQGGIANANYGNSVASAGDINGDGYAEVIVAAYRFTDDQAEEGRVYVYDGSPNGLLNAPSWFADGNLPYAQFGTSVSTAGDANGDGYNDVLVGSPNYDITNTGGRAFLFYGTSTGLSPSSGWTSQVGISGQAFAAFGSSVACAGDVDGNGISDVIIGAPYFHNGTTYVGKVYVYYGFGNGVSATPSWSYSPNTLTYQFGGSVSTAGDVNGDGYSDIIVGEPAYSNIQVSKGKAYLFSGSSTGLVNSPSWTSEGTQNNELYATSVSTAGDVNGDGYSDVIVGAYHHNNGSNNIGAIFSFYGNEGSSRRQLIRQFIPNTYTSIYSGGYSGVLNSARFSISGVTPFGKSKGRILYEHKISGQPFSAGTNLSITNSTSGSGSGAYQFMAGTYGPNLNKDASGLSFFLHKETKWRARVQYDVYTSPYQKYGPWKYYTNYIPLPNWSLRPVYHSGFGFVVNARVFIQGFYLADSNKMVTSDTVKMVLCSDTPPYTPLDTVVSVVSEDGYGTFDYRKSPWICCRRIYVSHRNSIQTWSSVSIGTDSSQQSYDFTTSATQAFGDNMIQVNSKPLTFAIYSGDTNQDGTVDATDLSAVDNAANNFLSGYIATDLTGDNFVDGTDFAIADNNAANFVGAITP